MKKQTCPDCGKTFDDCVENGCDYTSIDPVDTTDTKINIGTNHGNITGIDTGKDFSELTGSEVLEIAKRYIKKRPITIYGWAPSFTKGFALVLILLLGSCTNYRYISRTQKKRVKKELKKSYPERLNRPHTFILFKPLQK